MLLRYKPCISPFPGFTEMPFLTPNWFPHGLSSGAGTVTLSITHGPPGALAWEPPAPTSNRIPNAPVIYVAVFITSLLQRLVQ